MNETCTKTGLYMGLSNLLKEVDRGECNLRDGTPY